MKIRHEVFVMEVATEIYEKGFYGSRPKPAAAKYGENDHFIIGCCLKSFRRAQRLSFLKDMLNESTFEKHEECSPPQLIFCLDRPEPSRWPFPRRGDFNFQILARVWVAYPPGDAEGDEGWDEDVWKKVVTKEEMFQMLEEIRNKKIRLYEA